MKSLRWKYFFWNHCCWRIDIGKPSNIGPGQSKQKSKKEYVFIAMFKELGTIFESFLLISHCGTWSMSEDVMFEMFPLLESTSANLFRNFLQENLISLKRLICAPIQWYLQRTFMKRIFSDIWRRTIEVNRMRRASPEEIVDNWGN